MNEEDKWFLQSLALAMLVRLNEIEQLPNENSLRNSKTIEFCWTKKEVKQFVNIVSGL